MVRRRAKRKTSLLSAMILEVATLLGIVALAQPTWSHRLIESMARPESKQPLATSEMEATATPAISHVAQKPAVQALPPQVASNPQPWTNASAGWSQAAYAPAAAPTASAYHSYSVPSTPSYSFDTYH